MAVKREFFMAFFRAIFCGVFCAMAFCRAGFGAIVDNREYVDWKDYPKLVFVENSRYGTCTGQFVAPNIILTAAHCAVTKYPATDEKPFTITDYKGQKFKATMIERGHYTNTNDRISTDDVKNDWIFLLVSDKQYYSSEYFDLYKDKPKVVSVTNVGWGRLKIINSTDIDKLRDALKNNSCSCGTNCSEQSVNNICKSWSDQQLCKDDICKYEGLNKASKLIDSWDRDASRLKSSKCDVLYDIECLDACKYVSDSEDPNSDCVKICGGIRYESKLYFPYVLENSGCVTAPGNSGGPYYSGNSLVGIVSTGSAYSRYADDISFLVEKTKWSGSIVGNSVFMDALQKLRQEYPPVVEPDNASDAATVRVLQDEPIKTDSTSSEKKSDLQRSNVQEIVVTECKPCKGNYGVICRNTKVDGKCVYETKCRNSGWMLFNNGQYDAYCEEPPKLDASKMQINRSCSDEELESLNAVMGTKNSQGQCEPIVCEIDYEIVDGQCVKQTTSDSLSAVEATEAIEDLTKKRDEVKSDIEKTITQDKGCVEDDKCLFKVASRFAEVHDYDERIKKLEEDYKNAKERETSVANRILSGATIAATGLGGMELARGIAEQSVDRDAAADMAAYMATFQCKIGDNGNKINGGDMGITTPGANQLINLYQSYVDLAASVKARKADLGLRPGIEADVVLDKSATGLYDDKGNGVQNGTYASLYRAARGNQSDIDKLAEQSDASTNRVQIGGTAAGVGAVGGAVGNVLINKDGVNPDQNILQQAAGLFLGK